MRQTVITIPAGILLQPKLMSFPIRVQCCFFAVSTDIAPPNVDLKYVDVELDMRSPVNEFRSIITTKCRGAGADFASWTIFIRNSNELAAFIEIPPSCNNWSDRVNLESKEIADYMPPSVVYLEEQPDLHGREDDAYKNLRPDIFVVDFGFIDRAIADAVRQVRYAPAEPLLPWLRVDLEYEGCMRLSQRMKAHDIFQLRIRKLSTFLSDRAPIPPIPDDFRICEKFTEVDRSNFFMGLNNRITAVLSQYVLAIIKPLASSAAELVLQLPDEQVHARLVKHSRTEGVFYKTARPHKLLKGCFLVSHSHVEAACAQMCCVKDVPRDHAFAVIQNTARSVTHGYAIFKPSLENDDILNAYIFLHPACKSPVRISIHPNSRPTAR